MGSLWLPRILARTASLYPQRNMITYGRRSYSYHDSLRIVRRLAHELRRLNVKGKVIVAMPNSPEFIFTIFALCEIRATPIPVNTGFTPYEMELIREDSGAAALSTWGDERVYFRFLGSDELYTFTVAELLHNGGPPAVDEEFNPADEAIMFYTSGSTGRMKGVVHTFDSLCSNPQCLVEIMDIAPEDTYFIGAPFCHLFGFSPGMVTAIMRGAEIVMADTIGSIGVIDIIEQRKISVLLCNATMLKQLLSMSERRAYNLTSLRLIMVSGSLAQQELLTAAIRRLCKNTLNLYGSTETGIIAQTVPGDDIAYRTTTVGKPLRGIEIRTVDDGKRELPSGSVGELACRTFSRFRRYHGMPSQTSEAVDSEGWYYTGDMGKVEESGHIRIVGRKNEMILKSGFNVYPREVEVVLLQHPKIKDAAVVGISDSIYGEIIRAVVIKRENEDLKNSEIRDYCREKLIYYKVPDQIITVKEFPLTSTGKVRKNELRSIVLDEANVSSDNGSESFWNGEIYESV